MSEMDFRKMGRLMILQKHKLFIAFSIMAMFLSSCASNKLDLYSQSAAISGKGGTYKVGNPYQIAGKWYYPEEDYDYVETGTASWYGKDFHAKYTANGEIYDMNTLTAAHRTLPLPSIVRVTNLENGRSLVLRVNDRGPFAKNRIIDVSKRASQLLGFQTQGTAKVKVEILAEESKALKAALTGNSSTKYASNTNKSNTGKIITIPKKVSAYENQKPNIAGEDNYYVQAGSFSNMNMAQNLKNQLQRYGQIKITPADVNGSTFYRVRVGPFTEQSAADSALAKIRNAGLTDAKLITE